MTYYQTLRPVGAVLCSTAGCPSRLTGRFRFCDQHLPRVVQKEPAKKQAAPKAKKPKRDKQPQAVTEARIIAKLERAGGVANSGVLARDCAVSTTGLWYALTRLVALGRVVRVRHRVYALPGCEAKAEGFLYPRQEELDRRVLEAMPVGRIMLKGEVFDLAGSLHSGRLTLARLQRLGRVEVISTRSVRRVK